jgi:hypothetical protein
MSMSMSTPGDDPTLAGWPVMALFRQFGSIQS